MSGLFGPVEVVGGIAVGTGVGAAVGDVVVPKLQDFLNQRWAENQNKPLAASAVAGIVAEDVERLGWGVVEASLTGISEARFQALYGEALNAPGVPELLTLLRRKLIQPGDFAHGLRKAKLEGRWDGAVLALSDELLDPAVLAVAIQRGIIPDPGILPVAPGSGAGVVPAFPVFNIDAFAEAAGSGVSRERLSVMVGNVGLPASNEQAASAYFRGIITLNDYHRAISEGNTRNEWRDAILAQARQIPSAIDFVAARLRAWIDTPAMHAGAGLHGMAAADADLLLKIHGRPLSWHQVFIGLRRGGVYDGPTTSLDPAFLKALEESDIRPEWYHLAWAQRFTYPAAFVLRSLTEGGDITEAQAHEILLFEGWEPALAATVSAKWAAKAAGAGAVDPHVKKAQTSLWTALHKSYVAGESDATTVGPGLTQLGLDGAAQADTLALWGAERNLVRHQLTVAQIKKAYKEGVTNPTTGQPWSEADVIAALVARGYTGQDAITLFNE